MSLAHLALLCATGATQSGANPSSSDLGSTAAAPTEPGSSAAPSADPGSSPASAAWCPAATFDGERVVVGWSAPEGVFATTLSQDGAVRQIGRVAGAGTFLTQAVSAKDSSVFLMVKRDPESGVASILVTRLGAGQVTAASPTELGVGIGDVAAASDGRELLVAWAGGSLRAADVYGARFDAASPSGRRLITIATGAGEQDRLGMAARGGEYLVVWNDNRRLCSDRQGSCIQAGRCYCAPDELFGTFVRAGGAGPAARLGALAHNADPLVAADASGFFVVWPERADASSPPYSWVVSRVDDALRLGPHVSLPGPAMQRSPVLFAPGDRGYYWITSAIIEVDNRPYTYGGPGGSATKLALYGIWLDAELRNTGPEMPLFEAQPGVCVALVNDTRGSWLVYDDPAESAVLARRISQQGWRGEAVRLVTTPQTAP